jgi:hypothetical protein
MDIDLIHGKIARFEACLNERDMTDLLNFIAPVNSSVQDPDCQDGSFILAQSNKRFLNRTMNVLINELASCPTSTHAQCPTCPPCATQTPCPSCPTTTTTVAPEWPCTSSGHYIGPPGCALDSDIEQIFLAVNPLFANVKDWECYIHFPQFNWHQIHADAVQHYKSVLKEQFEKRLSSEINAAVSAIDQTCGGSGGSALCAICDILTCYNPLCIFTNCCSRSANVTQV